MQRIKDLESLFPLPSLPENSWSMRRLSICTDGSSIREKCLHDVRAIWILFERTDLLHRGTRLYRRAFSKMSFLTIVPRFLFSYLRFDIYSIMRNHNFIHSLPILPILSVIWLFSIISTFFSNKANLSNARPQVPSSTRPPVRPSVRPSVCPSILPSVSHISVKRLAYRSVLRLVGWCVYNAFVKSWEIWLKEHLKFKELKNVEDWKKGKNGKTIKSLEDA